MDERVETKSNPFNLFTVTIAVPIGRGSVVTGHSINTSSGPLCLSLFGIDGPVGPVPSMPTGVTLVDRWIHKRPKGKRMDGPR